MAELEPKTPKKRGPKPGNKRGGPVKGQIYAKTIAKEEAKAILRDMVLSELRPLVRGLMKKAQGVDHMMLRDENGQWKRMETEQEIAAALNAEGAQEGSTYWIHTKDPDVAAAKDILDRAIGKPVEEMQIEHSGEVGMIDRLRKARERSRT
jgi:hypothetical protein